MSGKRKRKTDGARLSMIARRSKSPSPQPSPGVPGEGAGTAPGHLPPSCGEVWAPDPHARQRSPLAARGLRGPDAAASGARVGCAVRGAGADHMGGQRVTPGCTVHGAKNCRAAAHERKRTAEGSGLSMIVRCSKSPSPPALSRSTGRGGRAARESRK
jgi:hypothetical protein